MKLIRTLAACLALAVSASVAAAQQNTPTQLAVQINAAVGNMALQLEDAQRANAAAQQQIKSLNDQIDALRKKFEPKPEGK